MVIGVIIAKNLAKSSASALVLGNLRNTPSSSTAPPELSLDIPFNKSASDLELKLHNFRETAKKSESVYDQNFIFYGILDFVNNVDNNHTMDLLQNDFTLWKESLRSKLLPIDGNSKAVYDYIKQIMRQCNENGVDLSQIELAKTALQKDDSHLTIVKKVALKCLKLHVKQERNGVNKLESNEQNEYSFIIDYFSKIITTIFDIHENLWDYKWGETKLAASKEEENLGKKGNERRSAGSLIDGIFYVSSLNIDLLLLEVSGPMSKEDYTHFLGDRLKIARNLKRILKSMYRKSYRLTEAKDVNVYGLHVYRNTIYLYSMSMPLLNIYCFSEVLRFDIPINPSQYPKEMPHYIKNLMKMIKVVKAGYDAARNYAPDYGHTSDYSICASGNFNASPSTSPKLKPRSMKSTPKNNSSSSKSSTTTGNTLKRKAVSFNISTNKKQKQKAL